VLRERFDQGLKQMQQGRYQASLDIFSDILEEDPRARGSLLMSGLINNRLLRFGEASRFFDRFLTLEPDHVSGNLGALKAYQSSGRTAEATAIRNRVLDLWRHRDDPRFEVMISFEREVRALPSGSILSIQEAFPGKGSYQWKAILMDREPETIHRVLEWKVADATQRELMEYTPEDPALWILGEPIYEDGELQSYKVRTIHRGSLSYERAVAEVLPVLALTQ